MTRSAPQDLRIEENGRFANRQLPTRDEFNVPAPAAVPSTAPTPWVPVVEIFEEDDTVRVVAEVPGVPIRSMHVALEGNRLTISGEKMRTFEEPAVKIKRHERTYGQFKRTFRLGAAVDFERASAICELGVLTITLPKAESAKRHQVAVAG